MNTVLDQRDHPLLTESDNQTGESDEFDDSLDQKGLSSGWSARETKFVTESWGQHKVVNVGESEVVWIGPFEVRVFFFGRLKRRL